MENVFEVTPEMRETLAWKEIVGADTEILLKLLNEERGKFTESDHRRIKLFIAALIEKGEYPSETVEGNPNSVWQMVKGWGAYWHRWDGTLECPHCKADLRDLVTGPPFMRAIGHTVNDRCAYYTCPDCNEKF